MAERLSGGKGRKSNKKGARAPAQSEPLSPQGGNLTDETIVKLLDEAVELREVLESSQGVYRNHIKRCKAAGIEPDDIGWYIKSKKRDPREIDMETKRRNRIARLMKLPLGTQLGLWDDGQTVASKVENDTGVVEKGAREAAERRRMSTTESLERAATQGEIAGRENLDRAGNPYENGSPEHIKWDYGWLAGEKMRKDQAFETAAPAEQK